MLKKALGFILDFSLTKEMKLALNILDRLLPLTGRFSGLDLAKLVYAQLPESWKFPEGPATETEFLETIQSGQVFLSKVKALSKP